MRYMQQPSFRVSTGLHLTVLVFLRMPHMGTCSLNDSLSSSYRTNPVVRVLAISIFEVDVHKSLFIGLITIRILSFLRTVPLFVVGCWAALFRNG